MSVKTATFQLESEDIELANKVRSKYVNTGLSYGWKSSSTKGYDQGHWNKLIIPNSNYFPVDHNDTPHLDKHPEIAKIWDILQATLGDRGLYRVYINGYTFGTDGYAHQDDTWIPKTFGENTLSETAIMYLNPTWNIDWCGETVVFEDNEIIVSVLPKLGRVFVFDSNLWHASRPLSRICPALRSVLVIKTIDPAIVGDQMKFILNIASSVKHSGRTFFEHLFNTLVLLERRKASKEVAAAGLYHSVYGTESFNYSNPDITRDVVKNLIGEYSESLAYEFCNMRNRVNTLLNNTNNYNPTMLRDLILIEIANLTDQNKNDKLTDRIDALENRLKTFS
jgi:hypothetical protein